MTRILRVVGVVSSVVGSVAASVVVSGKVVSTAKTSANENINIILNRKERFSSYELLLKLQLQKIQKIIFWITEEKIN